MARSARDSNLFSSRGHLRLERLEERSLLSATAWSNYGRDAQHSAQSTVAGQSLDAIHWDTPVDSAPIYSGGDLLIHYGSPVVTANNTVIVPEKNETTPGGFDVKAFDGATGALKWTQTEGEEFVPPTHNWTPSYSPALAQLPGGTRLYFAGADGTTFYRDSPDVFGTVAAGRIAFYGIANYIADPAGFGDVRISSPLTVDSQGNLYFTYQASGTNPLGLQGGIARIGADGSKTYSEVGTPALDSAPALSNDATKLYVAVNGFLVEYNSTTLAPLAQVQLGSVNIDSSASPTVGPDGDVYFGVLSPFDHDRGSLEHFSGDLSTTHTPGSFGWDDTVSIVPAAMVPSYSGPSSYLLMTKYNDYAGDGGTGINKIAIIDPNTTATDAVTGRLAMATVLSIAGVTPDGQFPNNPGAVREWCINSAVVDPVSHSIFANSEDGWLYRWDTTTNMFTQRIHLTSGVGEAYTPTVVGADGTVFAINNATLFAVGATPSSVASRLLFYNQSAFDGNTAGVDSLDDSAISDKVAYLPGDPASTNAATAFVHESNYTKGINGLMVDLTQGATHASITASDFVFRVGVDDGAGNLVFSNATAGQLPTTVSTRAGAGAGGSDRVELIWADNALRNVWLEVQVKADANTGLAANANDPAGIGDVFYFANKAGDTANDNGGSYITSASDQLRIHLNAAVGVGVDNTFDVNKDGNVTPTDQLAAHLNAGIMAWFSTGLTGPFAPDPGPSAPNAAPAAAPSAAAASLSISDIISAAQDSALASGITGLLNGLGSGVPPWLQSRLVNILDSAPAVKILHALEQHNSAVDRLILQTIDTLADKYHLHDDVLDGILADLGLE